MSSKDKETKEAKEDKKDLYNYILRLIGNN